MPRGSLARRTSNVTIDNANWELRTQSTARALVEEISVTQLTGTASSYGIGTPAARGVTPTTPVAFQSRSNADAALATTVALAWGTSPTAPTVYLRRWNTAATVGVGVIYTFVRSELVVPVSASLTIHNITAAVALDVNCVISERAP